MMRRRISALAASLALHLVALAIALVTSSTSSGRGGTAPSPRPRSITVFAASREDDSAPPGLNAIDVQDQDAMRRSLHSQTVAVPGFIVNVAKIAERASLLFPFVTPGLSLERFAIAPERESRETFHDPFAPPRDPRSKDARAQPPLSLWDAALHCPSDPSWSGRNRRPPFQRR